MRTIFLSIITILAGFSSLMANGLEKITEKDFAGYLFEYFTGNDIKEEAIRYALS